MRHPNRRSRKIGLTQGGRVRDGRASEKLSRVFTRDIWERLSLAPSDGAPTVLRENPSGVYLHPCRGSEYLAVLGRLPPRLSEGLRAVVLRRTPRLDAGLGVEARKRFRCVILNAFPRTLLMTWETNPTPAARRHYARWCSGDWLVGGEGVSLRWRIEEVRRYYQYHLFLHELGHINQPWFHSARRREEYAENFALEWASRLGELPTKRDA
jgi:hypothetical protein